MRPDDYAKLEKNVKFKKSYLNNTKWWKHAALMAPVVLMFGGLVGILYLFNMDKLISVSVIPYLLLFAVGTILFKAIKVNLQKRKMSEPGSGHVCMAVPVGEKDGYTYVVFTNDTHRYNKHYVKNLAKESSSLYIFERGGDVVKKKSLLIQDPGDKAGYYARAYKTKDIDKANPGWKNEGSFAVLYIDDNDTPVIKSRDLISFSK